VVAVVDHTPHIDARAKLPKPSVQCKSAAHCSYDLEKVIMGKFLMKIKRRVEKVLFDPDFSDLTQSATFRFKCRSLGLMWPISKKQSRSLNR
jgi:hypothetical protein